MGDQAFGIDPDKVDDFARQIKAIFDLGVEIGLVVGGGNIFRGLSQAGKQMERTQADFMGMMATIINAMAIQNSLMQHGLNALLMSGLKVEKVAEEVRPLKAKQALSAGQPVIFAGGTGNPFFTTDTGAVLRALEIDADAILKGTRVDGIYDKDPEKFSDAVKFDQISYDETLQNELKIMDATAFALAKENKLPIIVFNMDKADNLVKIIKGEAIGTMVN